MHWTRTAEARTFEEEADIWTNLRQQKKRSAEDKLARYSHLEQGLVKTQRSY